MDKNIKWWSIWSPFWDKMENRHMNTHVTDKIINDIASPVLVIGAGQGLIVKHLRDKGYIADGVDIVDEMIKYAYIRHSIKLIKANARSLPFENCSYKTVIISSGVVDRLSDEKLIKTIINEAMRVVALHGHLFVAFYQVERVLERIYKKIGILDSSGKLKRKRLNDIDELARKGSLLAVKQIMTYTNKDFLRVFFSWIKIRITFSRILKKERQEMAEIFMQAKEMNIDPKDLYDSLPGDTPYRERNEIKKLLDGFGLAYNVIKRFNECLIVKYYKSHNGLK
ncbi:MAG: class I SAM-dependent methyltransferase [Spirochaetales bacterium]|nr:class I SAM-dependent methyltransferase [Spirochaetales bacterium]